MQKEVENKRVWIEKDWHQHDVVVKSTKGEIFFIVVECLGTIPYHSHRQK